MGGFRYQTMWRRAVLSLAICALAACGAGSDDTAITPPPMGLLSCSQLAGQTLGGAAITSTTTVPASASVGAHCDVQGTVRAGFQFEIKLPAQWNDKLVYNGGGGWDGVIDLPAVPTGPTYVTVASNGGHVGNPLDASFALNNPQAQNDFGYLSAHTVLAVVKEVMLRFYGRGAQRHYFVGCSNGGREALIQASRYPADYDAILSIAPAQDFAGLAQAFVHNAQALNAAGAAINSAKAGAIARAVVARCDSNDGVADGIVSWPQSCHFDPADLQCSGADNNSCLTAAQVGAARTIYAEFRDTAGAPVYPGWDAGGEDLGWPAWVANPPASSFGLQFTFGEGMVRYWLASDPNYNALDFSAANFQPQMAAAVAKLNASPNLSAFFSQGRKLVLAHGTHDWAISYKGSIRYFDEVAAASGGVAARDASMEFFLLPGVQHCGGGVGPDLVDLAGAITRWAETGERPSNQNLSVFKFDQVMNQITLTRPLCRYPSFPKYRGVGDVNSATSFSCATS